MNNSKYKRKNLLACFSCSGTGGFSCSGTGEINLHQCEDCLGTGISPVPAHDIIPICFVLEHKNPPSYKAIGCSYGVPVIDSNGNCPECGRTCLL